MNFFEHQEQSRRQTRWLLFLFVLAVLAIIVAVDLVLLVGFGLLEQQDGAPLLSAEGLRRNAGVIVLVSALTAALIAFASLFRTLQLRGGGGEVARQLGGVPVDASTRDPLRRRLVNVVEEIAVASGVPVPEIYVLEQEAGINAFAAGYSASDAAVAVTRGTLEKLDRAELQGVIAHEFSHVLNGDMRLNIRLMGALFGILLLALIGRKVLYHGRYVGGGRNKDGLPLVLIALALTVIGYVGLFFGRWIKSSVSRSREYLADASAVQFTRDPDGVAGALKKIAVYSDASWLHADTEEIGHMLFGPGTKMNLFATHPPLMRRIERIEPNFREQELEDLARRIRREREQRQRRRDRRDDREDARAEAARPRGVAALFDPANLLEQIGNPDFERLLLAAAIAAGLPDPVRAAARDPERAPTLLFHALLSPEPAIRALQLEQIREVLGEDVGARVESLLEKTGLPAPEQRLPLLEITLPSLRRHPPERVHQLLLAVDRVIRADERIDVFEYLLARINRQFLWEAANPHRVRLAGRRSLAHLAAPAREVLAVLALHGHLGDEEGARIAYAAGVEAAFGTADAPVPAVDDWVGTLDAALEPLDTLDPAGKQRLLAALAATVSADQRLLPEELELMRAIAAALHVPVPVLTGALETAGSDGGRAD